MIDVVRNIAIAYRAHMPPEVDNKPTCIAYMFTFVYVDTQENRQTDGTTYSSQYSASARHSICAPSTELARVYTDAGP